MISSELFQLLPAVVIPLFGGVFMLVWSSIARLRADTAAGERDLWSAVNKQRDQLSAFMTDAERRFVKDSELRALESRLDDRLDRIEVKLDRAFTPHAGALL